MAITTTVGSILSIGGVRAPATDTSAEYAALTWVAVGEIENLGEIGDEAAAVTFRSIADARVRKLKGAYDAGTLGIVVGRDPLNAGQIAMKAGAATKFEYAFKIEAADKLDANDTNSIYYFGALIMSQRDNYGEADNVVRTTFNLGINTPIIEVVATVVP